ncbi:hypothetical protein [Streptomyces sp. SBT349]|uniref:hypothetical protein n=1 Tax=Streptomyces sp. SBT349 TaxID=1580539 RepID=UPI00069E17F4|nr:hypothetical protein [Streptomyces sp. SBT349]
MSREAADWDAWMALYARGHENPPSVDQEPCPNCGARAVRLVFVEKSVTGDGPASLWCGSCLQGIYLSRTWIPDNAERLAPGATPEEVRAVIPNYTVIWPDAEDEAGNEGDEDIESHTF